MIEGEENEEGKNWGHKDFIVKNQAFGHSRVAGFDVQLQFLTVASC